MFKKGFSRGLNITIMVLLTRVTFSWTLTWDTSKGFEIKTWNFRNLVTLRQVSKLTKEKWRDILDVLGKTYIIKRRENKKRVNFIYRKDVKRDLKGRRTITGGLCGYGQLVFRGDTTLRTRFNGADLCSIK